MRFRGFTALSLFFRHKPLLGFVLVLLAWTVIALPLTMVELTIDDLWHRQLLLAPQANWWRDLFVFLRADNGSTPSTVLSLGLPWWTDAAVKIAFFRPLTALTHWLDYRLWPGSAPMMHFVGIVIYGVACLLLFLLYRRLLTANVALLAAILFTVDVQHLFAVGWIANRNSLLALCFVALAILAHLHVVRAGRNAYSAATALMLLLALLSGEVGTGGAGYLLGVSVFIDRRAWSARLGALLLPALVGVGWLVYYLVSGYGAGHSGLYGGFASGHALQSLARLPFLAALFTGAVPAQLWPQDLFGPTSGSAAVMIFLLAGMAWLLYPVVKAEPVARCLLLGALLALPPVANSIAADRNLPMFGIGGHGLLAMLLAHWWRARDESAMPRLRNAACWALALLHALVSPLLALAGGAGIMLKPGEPYAMARDLVLDDQRPLIVLQAPTGVAVPTLGMQRGYLGLPMPAAVYVLSLADAPVTVERLDARRLRVTLAAVQNNMAGRAGLIFRDFSRSPLQPDQQITYGDMTVTVERLGAQGLPLQYVVEFANALDSYQWLSWRPQTRLPEVIPAP